MENQIKKQKIKISNILSELSKLKEYSILINISKTFTPENESDEEFLNSINWALDLIKSHIIQLSSIMVILQETSSKDTFDEIVSKSKIILKEMKTDLKIKNTIKDLNKEPTITKNYLTLISSKKK